VSAIPRLETERLLLTLPSPEAAARVAAYFAENREHHAPWDPARPDGFFEEPYWRVRLGAIREEVETEKALRLFLFARAAGEAGPILGTVNFTNFMRGQFMACFLGYGLARSAEGKGLMFEALQAATAHVFETLGFHRIQANHLPTNERSARLLRRLGFVVEGYARDYLHIRGAWRDHVLTSLTSPRPRTPLV
jgi:ribosomal-protein-alanine N-acetyltransferase